MQGMSISYGVGKGIQCKVRISATCTAFIQSITVGKGIRCKVRISLGKEVRSLASHKG